MFRSTVKGLWNGCEIEKATISEESLSVLVCADCRRKYSEIIKILIISMWNVAWEFQFEALIFLKNLQLKCKHWKDLCELKC